MIKSGSVLNKHMIDNSTTIIQFSVFSNSLQFPYHVNTPMNLSEFIIFQNLKTLNRIEKLHVLGL